VGERLVLLFLSQVTRKIVVPAAAAWLVQGGQSVAAVNPQTRGDHPAAQRIA
jgi:hypothetical protein